MPGAADDACLAGVRAEDAEGRPDRRPRNMISPALQRQFEAAGEHMRSSHALERQLTIVQKLELYGLFKQATKGDCGEDQPSVQERKEYLKWEAWVGKRGVSRAEAMEDYVNTIRELDPTFAPPAAPARAPGADQAAGSYLSAKGEEEGEEAGAEAGADGGVAAAALPPGPSGPPESSESPALAPRPAADDGAAESKMAETPAPASPTAAAGAAAAGAEQKGDRGAEERAPRMKGILYKQRDVFRGWRPRTFELQGCVLRYWVSVDDAMPRATISLHGATVTAVNASADVPMFHDDASGEEFYPFVIAHPGSAKAWNLAATSFKDLVAWVEALSAAARLSPDAAGEALLSPQHSPRGSSDRSRAAPAPSAAAAPPAEAKAPAPAPAAATTAATAAAAPAQGLSAKGVPVAFSDHIEGLVQRLLRETQGTQGWTPAFEKKGVRAYRKAGADGCITVRGDGRIMHHPLAVLRCITDLQRKHKYDTNYESGERVAVWSPQCFADHITFKQVWPTTQRDMVNIVHWRVTEQGYLVVLACSKELDAVPERRGIVRAEVAIGGWVMRPLPRNAGVDCSYMVETDLKGTLPSSIKAMVAENQPLLVAAVRKEMDDYGDDSPDTSDADFCERPIEDATFEGVIPRSVGHRPFDAPPGAAARGAAPQAGQAPQQRWQYPPQPQPQQNGTNGSSGSGGGTHDGRARRRQAGAGAGAGAGSASGAGYGQIRPRDLLVLFLPVLFWAALRPAHPLRGFAFLTGLYLASDYLWSRRLGEGRELPRGGLWGAGEVFGDAGARLGVAFSVDLRRVLRFLEEQRSAAQSRRAEVTVTHIAMRAVALALSEPELRDLNGHVVCGRFYGRPDVDVSAVLRARGGKGLQVAKVPAAQRLSTDGIAQALDGRLAQAQQKGSAASARQQRRAFLREACPYRLRPLLAWVMARLQDLGAEVPLLGVEPTPFGTAAVLTLPHNRNWSNVDMLLAPSWAPGRMPASVVVTLGGICAKPRIVSAVKLTTASVLNVSVSVQGGDFLRARQLAERLQELMTDPSVLDAAGGLDD